MDPSFLIKQSMEDYSQVIQSFRDYVDESALGLNEPRHFQKRSCETCSDDDEHDWGSAFQTLQQWETGLYPWPQTSVITNQASRPTTIWNSTLLKSSTSSFLERERAQRKRKNDQAYRERCKKIKEDMQFNLDMLTTENESLKKENESLKEDNALMNGTLRDQAKEIDWLRSDLLQLKCEHEKQNVLIQTLSGLLSDPVRLENEKLKDENASLKKNANLNNLSPLAEENAKLRIENKVLKVQNDALCGKIISDSDNDKKHGQK